MISGIPDPAAAGANCVTIYTEEKTKTKLINTYTTKPATYDFCIIANVNANFQPAKFSTEILMKTAANPVPENNQNELRTVKIKENTVPKKEKKKGKKFYSIKGDTKS